MASKVGIVVEESQVGIVVEESHHHALLSGRLKKNYRIVKTGSPTDGRNAPRAIVQRIRKEVGLLLALGCNPVVLVVEFAGRGKDHLRFVEALRASMQKIVKEALRARGEIHRDVVADVVAANQTIENWLLADIVTLSKSKSSVKAGLKQKRYEGTDGKRELAKCFTRSSQYSEMRDAPVLFRAIHFPTARDNSDSFAEFLRAVGR